MVGAGWRVVLSRRRGRSPVRAPEEPLSVPGQAVRKVVAEDQLLASDDTIMELADVLARPKFDPYMTVEERRQFLRLFDRVAERIPITHIVRACRDPKDDKVLELAVNGAAQLIITGDGDLALHPFHGIDIITPAGYITR